MCMTLFRLSTASGASVALAAALGLWAHPAAAQAPNVQGLWRSGDTTIRITVQGKEARRAIRGDR